MDATAWMDWLTYAEPLACVVALVAIRYRSKLGTYRFLSAYLFIRALSTALGITLMKLGHDKHLSLSTVYTLYFWMYWCSYVVEAALVMGVIYSIYQLAMAPLRGLQQLGMLMFRWAAAISIAVAITMALGHRETTMKFIMVVASQIQQTQSTLALCMLLFVTFAIRPMGLSYQSKIFGVSLGLGIIALTDLVSSAWFAHATNMQSSATTLLSESAMLLALMTWTAYFAMPEPKRQIIVLPTTSPFLRWNQIAQALGDAPGFVAVGGVPPEVFAPSELEIMRRASMKIAVGQNQA